MIFLKKNRRIAIAIVVAITFLHNAYSQSSKAFETPISHHQLISYSGDRIEESFSEGDRLSLIAKSILLAEYDKERPNKIIEIECTLNKYEGPSEIYTTVHRDVFTFNKERQSKINEGFYILRDVSLSGVRDIEVKINVRSLNEDQSNMFKILANLIGSATINNPTINTVRALLKIDEDDPNSDNEIPSFDALFQLPNNYVNFELLNQSDNSLAYLTAHKDLLVAFEDQSINIPKKFLPKVASMIFGNELVKQTENIGGVITLYATKKSPEPLRLGAYESLDELYDVIRRGRLTTNERLDQFISDIDKAFESVDLLYKTPEERETSAFHNAILFLSTCQVYAKYIGCQLADFEDQDQEILFRNSFKSWYRITNNFQGNDDISTVPVSEIYSIDNHAERVTNFFLPNNLRNSYASVMLNMQSEMHLRYAQIVKDKSNLIERVSYIYGQ